MIQFRLDFGSPWVLSRDGDPDALALYERHYSARRYRDGRVRKLFVGPGQKMVLLSPAADALFVWRVFREIGRPSPIGVNCAVFRNESSTRSSDLIRAACGLAWARWPDQRLYTYVNPRKVRSRNPGWCFLCAGWQRCGRTKGGLLVLDCWPAGARPGA